MKKFRGLLLGAALASAPLLLPAPAEAAWHGSRWHGGWGWHAGWGWHGGAWRGNWGWRPGSGWGGVTVGLPAVTAAPYPAPHPFIPGHYGPCGCVSPHWRY